MRLSDDAAVEAQPFLSSFVTPGRAHRQDLTGKIAAGLYGIRCSTAASSTRRTEGACLAESFVLNNRLSAICVLDASAYGNKAPIKVRLIFDALRAGLAANHNVAVAVRLLNRELFAEVPSGAIPWPYVSGFVGIIDARDQTLRYVSCGHETAILFTGEGRHEHLPHNSPALGISASSKFRDSSNTIGTRDVLVAVTLGITDARPLRSQTDFFGSRGLCDLLQQPTSRTDLTASLVINRAVTFSDGRLDNDAAVLIARLRR
jgi:serine phosphatase RsbU (regulator of sigma subunit)